MDRSKSDFGELLIQDIAQKKAICCEVEISFPSCLVDNLVYISFHVGDLENLTIYLSLACALIEIG